ncbi:MAG: hypothetical protein Q8L77_10520 [Nitrospirota bacterium]|nr:hypothetical protein [Nitrospirota bacterium]
MKLFDTHVVATFGKRFQRLVEDAKSLPGASEYLEQMERYWRTYQPFASQDFQHQLLADDDKFYSLTWELMLGATLLEKGYHLEPSINDKRPDLCLILEGKRIWIECCLPTGGDPSKPNSVTETVLTSDGDFEFHDVDHDKSVLRCTQILSEKKRQHLRWIAKGVCNQDEPFLIALNGRNLQLSIFNSSLPQILRALYGTGDMYVVLDSKDAEYRESGYHFKPQIDKSETTPISTTFFLEKDNSHISGVLFSTNWIMRSSSTPQYCYVENRGGSGWLDSLGHFLSGAWRITDYAAVCRVVRWS